MRRQLMDLPGPRWKKGKDGKNFAALAATNPMSTIVAELQASLRDAEAVAILSGDGKDAILAVGAHQAALLNRAAFGRAVDNAGDEKLWFQLGPEEMFFLCHALRCITVESENKKQMGEGELWDLLTSTSEPFPEMYKAYEHLRLKNWVVRSGLQYGADFVAYRHHPALVHSEFAVIVVPEGKMFGARCGRMKVWPDLLCALRASGSVAKTLLFLTISNMNCEVRSSDCLEQLIVHERMINRWIPQQCREQQDKPHREEAHRDEQRQKQCREEAIREEQEDTREGVVFSYWGVILSFTILSSLLVYKLKL
ncbi:putative tRNA-splicing endonuclease subunit Sen2 [Panicum miliaceum]|uniref:tRNA-intron lyase n=1 Tax=Panicum miliaceum TaxID=4540 RepID=A0A3L6PAG7_PANMI|nr:putative tRNA-splicing endonuclease subunit Sen2 [Panicum miliaceum]